MVFPKLGIVTSFIAVVLLFWSPLLTITHLRQLFCWPTRWFVLNYLLIGTCLLVIQCLSYLLVILLVARTGMITGGDAVRIVGGIGIANLLVLESARWLRRESCPLVAIERPKRVG